MLNAFEQAHGGELAHFVRLGAETWTGDPVRVVVETHQDHIFRNADPVQFEDRFDGVCGIVESDDDRFGEVFFRDPVVDGFNERADVGGLDKPYVRRTDFQSAGAESVFKA